MTPQSTFMITAPIASEKETGLRELLATMNQAPGLSDPHNSLVPFYQFGGLHVARFVVINANTNDDLREHGIEPSQWQPTLAFIGDIDGCTDIFLAELAVRTGEGLRRIFSHCEDFDAEQTNLLEWMKQHNKQPAANYVNWRGRTVVQINEEHALSKVLSDQMLQVISELGRNNPQAIRRRLIEFVDNEIKAQRLRLSQPQPTPPGWFIKNLAHLIGVPMILLILSPVIAIGAPLFAIYLRILEKSDPEILKRPEAEHLHQLAVQEDLDVTNHFNVFGQVKPGYFRRYTIQFAIFLLDYASRHVYNHGYLTRIQTIHFARWVLLDDNKRVYFASNYDGSQESYMDDFINKVAWGLNLVFSNCVGYPRSRWLIKGGAEYEQKYKRALRRNQLPAESWYKAYPGLTAVDLARNSRIRKGLQAEFLSTDEIRDWLSLL